MLTLQWLATDVSSYRWYIDNSGAATVALWVSWVSKHLKNSGWGVRYPQFWSTLWTFFFQTVQLLYSGHYYCL